MGNKILRFLLVTALSLPATFAVIACGNGPFDPIASTVAITGQPSDASIPLTHSATFQVFTNANSPIYQWSRNGQPIPGATLSQYQISSVALTDQAARFSVLVTAGSNHLESRTATLTITARAPVDGDLRFQQVGESTTSNIYQGILKLNLDSRGTQSFGGSFGAPLAIGAGCEGTPPTAASGTYYCDYNTPFYFSLSSSHLTASYTLGYLTDFQDFLSRTNMPNYVVTGLDLEPGYDEYAASFVQTSDTGIYDGQVITTDAASAVPAIAAQGNQGRVVTALSYNGANITFLSYGSALDRTTAYDEVLFPCSFTSVQATFQSLSEQGYILTAIGGTQAAGVLLVGTRVHGDTLPRSFLTTAGDQTPFLSQSYAIVGMLYDSKNYPFLVLGQK